jgi:hypothetical protein
MGFNSAFKGLNGTNVAKISQVFASALLLFFWLYEMESCDV